MKWRALPIAGALCLLSAVATAFPVTELQTAGPVTQRFNVAILGDGYRASDQSKLTGDAKTLVNALFDGAPYKPYRQLFNFKVIQSVSQDQGAKGGSAEGSPSTLFGATYACEGVSQLICVDGAAVLTAAASDVPEFDLAIVVVNDTKYGGSGGNVPVVSTDTGAAEILRHELGHNIATLADEYQDAYPGYPACSPTKDCVEPNVTLRNTRAQIKWLDWIDDSTPVPTAAGKNFDGVGLFEGARYMSKGFYRPVDQHCKMQSLGEPFCPVCAEALVRSFWNLKNVSLIDEAEPATKLTDTRCVDATFRVKTPTIAPSTLSIAWAIDGKPQAETSDALLVSAGTLAGGAHTISAIVTDTTALVRRDPDGKLSQIHVFDYEAPDCAPDSGAGAAGRMSLPSAGGPADARDAGPSGAGGAGLGGSSASGGSAHASPPSAPKDEAVGCSCGLAPRRRGEAGATLFALLAILATARRRRS